MDYLAIASEILVAGLARLCTFAYKDHKRITTLLRLCRDRPCTYAGAHGTLDPRYLRRIDMTPEARLSTRAASGNAQAGLVAAIVFRRAVFCPGTMHMGLRRKLLLPIAVCGLLMLVYLAVGWVPGAEPISTRVGILIVVAAGLVLLLAVTSAAIDAYVRRPLAAIMHAYPCESAPNPRTGPLSRASNEIEQARTTIDLLHGKVENLEQALELATEQRSQIDVALRSSEERYVLAMRTADDGLWEWNLQTNDFVLSPRWKSMLGYDDEELPNTRLSWLQCVHPADAPAADAALKSHLDGTTPRYEQQLRLLHKDGRYRWVSSTGSVIRHANGRPSRLIALDTDVTRLRRIENILQHIVEGTSGTCGEDFFRTLVRHFAGALDVSCAFVTECNGWPPKSVHTLAFWFQDSFRENFEFELAGTPCEAVFNLKRPAFHATGVGKLFPRDEQFDSYYGLPIFNSERQVVGHMAFFDEKEMKEEDVLMDSVYSIFTARAAVEIERKMVLDRLTRNYATAAGTPAINQ
ncbi:PAS domain-containing protein [Paraburkholderia hospita]|nr:PAS domain-containing protein [Paraburkholderia hospita]